jgi:transforming growth factor-beta-induced protein
LALEGLSDILLYHVIPGEVFAADVLDAAPFEVETLAGEMLNVEVIDGAVFINDAQVVTTDIETSNGVIHVIDSVLLLPEEEVLDIVDTAIAAGDFETLVAALVETELDDALRAEGPFTVFAPSDDAFAALLTELDLTAEELLALEGLSDILLYHVIPGEVFAADVLDAAPFEVETLAGEMLSVEVIDGAVFINDAQVVTTDIETSNGVIHVIDSVLLLPVSE